MYALFSLLFIVGVVWTALIYRILVNVRRDNEIKSHTQKYYNQKIENLYGKVEETKEGEETETYSATVNSE
jgi:hypothetical protein